MHKSNQQPGVSGKTMQGKTWFNEDKYEEQREQVEEMDESEKGFAQSTGQNLIGRTDLSNQGEQPSKNIQEDQIFEALKRSPSVDVSHIQVKSDHGTVELVGTCTDLKEERAIINIVENISGVRRVVSHLDVLSDRG